MRLRFLSQLPSRLPSCYSQDFEKCNLEFSAAEKENREPRLSEFCAQYYDLWKSTPAADWEAALESIPFCPAPKKSAPLWLLGAGAAGLFLGLMIR